MSLNASDKTFVPQIPLPDFKENKDMVEAMKPKRELYKREAEYEAYCEWCATPQQEREPKTQLGFERKYHLSPGYTRNFRKRAEFRLKVFKLMLEYWIDKYPNLVYAQYKKAVKEGDTNAAKLVSEIISKNLDVEVEKKTVQPFVLVGVPQEKIDRLFTPPEVIEGEEVNGTDKS